jgi:hypothetical protein
VSVPGPARAYPWASFVVLLVGVLLCLLGAFGVRFGGPVDVFQLGVGVAFAAFLVP